MKRDEFSLEGYRHKTGATLEEADAELVKLRDKRYYMVHAHLSRTVDGCYDIDIYPRAPVPVDPVTPNCEDCST